MSLELEAINVEDTQLDSKLTNNTATKNPLKNKESGKDCTQESLKSTKTPCLQNQYGGPQYDITPIQDGKKTTGIATRPLRIAFRDVQIPVTQFQGRLPGEIAIYSEVNQ